MGNEEKGDVREKIAALESMLSKFWTEAGPRHTTGMTGWYARRFKELFLEALNKLPSDGGEAMKELYLRAIRLENEHFRKMNNEAFVTDELAEFVGEDAARDITDDMNRQSSKQEPEPEDGVYYDTFSWLTEEQMNEWKIILEQQGILKVVN